MWSVECGVWNVECGIVPHTTNFKYLSQHTNQKFRSSLFKGLQGAGVRVSGGHRCVSSSTDRADRRDQRPCWGLGQSPNIQH